MRIEENREEEARRREREGVQTHLIKLILYRNNYFRFQIRNILESRVLLQLTGIH
jgi:hypothetical protein